ncbi:MAG TPA: SUMF1/EgtB/PvdO family nonheme iron enzyme, partial [Actinomycetota bacterium]|nr:SUMF1/EgtB/PvdO family nonheme iron enzyme [Actinomycetota bacterium]
FLFGTAADEGLREYYKTAPIHPTETGAYFISRHETTWADWIEFLEALSPAERAKRTPSVSSTGFHGGLSLKKEGGSWRLTMQPGAVRLSAAEGEPIRYPKRERRAVQDWRKMPVAGINADDARAYAAWLASTGRVPNARLCTEREWERAARGADAREYPHGGQLAPDDANHDRTYGQVPESFGPDEVGAHPVSESPFGVHDLSGNVWEWVESSLEPGSAIARGGSYYFSASTARVVNREKPEQTLRDLTVGVRICAGTE